MAVDFWWVRHAPTWADTMVGHTDVAADLSDKKALSRLAKFLPADAAVISSDLSRSSQTADAITGNRQRLAHSPNLREIFFGDWEGQTFDAVAHSHPDLSRNFWENPGHVAPPNGESWDIFSNRIKDTIHHILENDPPENLILVAHFGVILAALQHAANLPSKSVFSFKISNLSITRLSFLQKSAAWSIRSVNQNL